MNTYAILISFLFEDDILKIVRSNEPTVIQSYLEDYVILLQNRMNDYMVELTTQSLSCPVTLPTKTSMSLEILDRRLTDFVRLHHLDLKRQVNYHISKLRDTIREKELVQESSLYAITTEQVISMYRLIEFVFALYFDCRKKSSVV